MSARTVLIGLDGATWDLLRPWIEDGTLPNLQSVYADGFRGTLNSTLPANTMPAVQSLYTGCDPSHLGIFGFQKPDGTTISLNDVVVPKIWTALGDHDRSSCIVNVRTTFPPDEINGVMLSGDPVPGEASAYAYPPELKSDVAGFRCEVKDDRMHKELVPPYEHRDEVLQHAIDIFTHRFGTFQELVAADDYDFQMYWIGETDFLQHRLWEDKSALREFYEVLDEHLGKFLEDFDGNVVFVSDHGFEGPADTTFYANEWLHRNGYLDVPGGRVGSTVLGVGQTFAREYVNKEYLMKVLYFLQQRETGNGAESDEEAETVNEGPDGINKPHLQIPGISSTSTAQLATNCGIEVRAGDDSERIANEIKEKLESLTDDQGRPIMRDVVLASELYGDGPYADDVPEILFQAASHVTVKALFSRSVIEEIPANQRSRRGRHVYAREGILFGTGPDFSTAEGVEADITDITPTLLHLFGLPVGERMDGEVRRELFADDTPAATNEIRKQDYADTQTREMLDDREQEEMEEWLEDMGYV